VSKNRGNVSIAKFNIVTLIEIIMTKCVYKNNQYVNILIVANK